MKLKTPQCGITQCDTHVDITLTNEQFTLMQMLVDFHVGSYTNNEDAPFDVGVFEELHDTICE